MEYNATKEHGSLVVKVQLDKKKANILSHHRVWFIKIQRKARAKEIST